MRLRLGSGERLLDDELTRELNPMTFEIVRAEGLPPDYSGNSGLGGPFEELARSCGHVYVSLRLPQGLGTFVTTSQPHASTLRWNEKRTIFAGTLDPQSLLTELSSEALELELHDRDPLPKAARAAAEGSGANDDSAAGGGAAAAEAAEGAPAAAGEDAAATAADDKLKQPFGVASVNLAALVPKPHGDRPDVKAFASRRQTVVVQVVPSERAAERAPPDSSTFPFFPVDTLPYYPGKYVENGTCVTIKVESAVPLRARPRGFEHDLQRVVVTMRYDDTKLLGRMSRVIEQVNSMSGVSSTSSWSEYKASGLADERLDCLSGFQLTDGTLRLFVVEGGFARWEAGTGADDDQPQPLNGMAALAVVLRRTDASERKLGRRYLTNWKLHFPKRLYTAFETPLKLIKLRQPFSELMSKPNVYVHGRVPEACARALTRIFSTLAMDRLRDMHKNSLWVPVDALLELDKKFGDVLTVADRHGVRENTVEVERDAVRGAAKDASGTQDGEAEAERVPVSKNKADTDSRLPTSFAESIRARRTREPLDYVKRNAEPLVCANPLRPKRVFEFSRDDLAGPDGQVYIYSSQRYSSAMLHQAQLRKACQEEAERTGVLRTYNAEYLSAAEIGEESEDEVGARATLRAARPARRVCWRARRPARGLRGHVRRGCWLLALRARAERTPAAAHAPPSARPPRLTPQSGDEREGRGSEWDSSGPQILLWDQRQYDKTGDGWVRSLWQIKQPDPGRLDYIRQPWVEPQPGKVRASCRARAHARGSAQCALALRAPSALARARAPEPVARFSRRCRRLPSPCAPRDGPCAARPCDQAAERRHRARGGGRGRAQGQARMGGALRPRRRLLHAGPGMVQVDLRARPGGGRGRARGGGEGAAAARGAPLEAEGARRRHHLPCGQVGRAQARWHSPRLPSEEGHPPAVPGEAAAGGHAADHDLPEGGQQL